MYSPIDILRARINARMEPTSSTLTSNQVQALRTLRKEEVKRLDWAQQELDSITTELDSMIQAEQDWADGAEARMSDRVTQPVHLSTDIANQALNATRETLTRLTESVQKETEANKRQQLGSDINTVKAEIAAIRQVISANDAKISRYVHDGITPEGEHLLPFSRKKITLTRERQGAAQTQVDNTKETINLIDRWLNTPEGDNTPSDTDVEMDNLVAALVALDNRYNEEDIQRGQIIRTLASLSHLNVINDLRDALNAAHEREAFLDS